MELYAINLRLLDWAIGWLGWDGQATALGSGVTRRAGYKSRRAEVECKNGMGEGCRGRI